jgi:hypothetical protein
MQTLSTPSPQQLVREYASPRAFHRDARELYARTHYTVADATGLAHRRFFLRARQAFGLCAHPVVITYQAPATPWPVNTATS